MTRLTKMLIFAYGIMLCGVGIVGIFTAPWELARVFHLDLLVLDHDVRATFLNQYRFLKGLELGGGIFCVVFLRQIMEGGTSAKVFLALVGAGVFARSFAWVVDGRPSWPFVMFLVLEALVFVVTMRHFWIQPSRGRADLVV